MNAVDSYRSELLGLRGAIIAIWAIALIIVCLRFLARRLSNAGLWYDDWLMIPATLIAATLCFISTIWSKFSELYRKSNDGLLALRVKLANSTENAQDSDELASWEESFNTVQLLGIFISQVCWVAVLWIVKCSILAFYWRLFKARGRLTRVVIRTVTLVVMCWAITVLFTTIFQCYPVYKFWEQPNGNCFGAMYNPNPHVIYMGWTIPHIISDAVLLILPLPLVWKIQMRRSQKVLLTAIFALGFSVTVVSEVRLWYFFVGDESKNTIDSPFLLTNIEINISIICACLPSLGPLITFISTKVAQIRKRKSTHKRGSKLLRDLLPVFRAAESSSTLPPMRKPSWNDGPNPMLDSSPIVEVEANPRVRELDAEAPGPHILEMGTVVPIYETETMEPALEMETVERAMELESQRPIAELEATNKVRVVM